MGDPAEKILEYANENKVDLIVMGTVRRKGISKYVSFGSVSKKGGRKFSLPHNVNPLNHIIFKKLQNYSANKD